MRLFLNKIFALKKLYLILFFIISGKNKQKLGKSVVYLFYCLFYTLICLFVILFRFLPISAIIFKCKRIISSFGRSIFMCTTSIRRTKFVANYFIMFAIEFAFFTFVPKI